MLKFIIYALSFSLLSTVTYFLMKSGDGKRSTKIFTLLIAISLLWIASLWVADSTQSNKVAVSAVNLAVFFLTLITWVLLYFALEYERPKTRRHNLFLIIALVYNAAFLMAAISSRIVPSVSISEYGSTIVNSARLYDLHVIQANGFSALAIILLNIKKKYLDDNGKKQVAIMTYGLIVAIVGNGLSGVVSTYLDNLQWLNFVGTFSMAMFIAIVGYAIIKHKLFDIRAVVARSFAYALVLTTLALTFAGVALPLVKLVIPEDFSQDQRLAIYTVIAVVVAMIFQPVKRFFDRITNKIFYKNAYDTQVILDQVSSVIIGSVDPHKVQRGALAAISDALRPTYMTFLLARTGDGSLLEGDCVGQKWSMHDPIRLQAVLKRIKNRIVSYDAQDYLPHDSREVLRTEDISVIAPLVTKDEMIGYLIIGPKKSGNTYNSQDIGMLNIATNELAVALQNARRFEEIQAFNATLQRNITDATRELKATNKKLVALDEAKDEFISMASHQLRTPLTSIKGYLSMMVEGDLGKVTPAQEKALKEAFGSSQRMVYLIADFLNVSRIRTGKFMIETKEVDLPQIVTEEITQLREMAGSRDLTLIYDQPGEFPRVKLDDNKIRQVMMNMVDNAIYYTPSGGTITIQLYSTGDEVIFKVVDNGIGVPRAEKHKLFTKFYRAGNARKSRPDGTGLGLFMAQKIVVEQGGAIIFESEEGKGSTFGFRFPLKKIRV